MTRRTVAYWFVILVAVGSLIGCNTSQKPPAPSVTIGAGVRLPEGCNPEKVLAIVTGFLQALSGGNTQDALKYFGEGFQWYSAPAGGTEERKTDTIRSLQDLGPYFVVRTRQQEKMRLQKIQITGLDHLGGVDFAVNLNRTADDLNLGAGDVVGKGTVDCGKSTIMVWSLGASTPSGD